MQSCTGGPDQGTRVQGHHTTCVVRNVYCGAESARQSICCSSLPSHAEDRRSQATRQRQHYRSMITVAKPFYRRATAMTTKVEHLGQQRKRKISFEFDTYIQAISGGILCWKTTTEGRVFN